MAPEKLPRTYWIAAVIIIIAIPLVMLYLDAVQRGQAFDEYLRGLFTSVTDTNSHETGEALDKSTPLFLTSRLIGEGIDETPPWITHVITADLDRDGLLDVIACDAIRNQIVWIHQTAAGQFQEIPIGASVPAPAHAAVSDIDGDGDLDVLVAVMGAILPTNDKIGAIVILENNGSEQFTNRVIDEQVSRVTDVQAGDFDGDGDIDLSIGQFGYYDGEIRWLEQTASWQFESHQLLNLSGTIHTPVGDLDGDGDLDIAAVVSQEWEEIYAFENDGNGNFTQHLVYGSTNEDFGSSGLSLADLDLDGDLDMLYTNGDAFDYSPPGPRPWHGVQWLENNGSLAFEYHRIGDFPGAYAAQAVDGDRDGDLDVFLVSTFNAWDDPTAQSLSWFRNDGNMEFTLHDLASSPTHLLTLTSGDINDDGWTDLVTGSMHVYPPYDRMGRVTLWTNTWSGR